MLKRLQALAPLSEDEVALVHALGAHCQTLAAGAEILDEGDRAGRPRVILSGWACKTRVLSDGRRQILHLLLPGDVVGFGRPPRRPELADTVALTVVEIADGGEIEEAVERRRGGEGGLARALVLAAVVEEASLLDHLVRLGRQTALERMAHLLLELRWRLAAAGLASGRLMPMPLTQEMLADTLGLSIVHVNRTLQQLRRDRLIESRAGQVELLDPETLAAIADYKEPKLSDVAESRRRFDG